MAKRTIAIVMLIIYCFSFSALPAYAAGSGYNTAKIVVESYGNRYTEQVLVDGKGNVYSPVTWLTRYGLLAYKEESSRYVFYNVGEEAVKPFAKRIYIDKSGNKVSCGCYVSETKFETYLLHQFSRAFTKDSVLYLPMAELLPLMNAKIEITDDSILHINANTVSVFSALYGLQLQDMVFDAETDIIGSEFMTATGMLIDTILGLRIDRLDGLYNTGEYNDYIELFKAYLVDDAVFLSSYDKNQTPAEKYISDKKETLKEIDDLLSDTKLFPDMVAYVLDSDLYPEFHEFKDFYSDISDVAEGIYKIGDYSNTYVNQVDDHLDMLNAVYNEKYFGEANPAYKAAKQITSVYGANSAKQRKEVVHSALRDFIVDEFNNTAIKEFGLKPYSLAFKAVKLVLPESVEIVGDAAQLGYMDDVVHHASKVFEKRVQNLNFDEKSLNDLRLTAMLALVASRHAYDTFWDDYYKLEDINKALERLYLAAESVECESKEYYSKKQAEINKTISKLKLTATNETVTQETNTIFDGTYWYMSFGQSLGWAYDAKFSKDGTFVARSYGSGEYKNGKYSYNNGYLTIVLDVEGFGYPSTIQFNGGPSKFTSLEKYPMQVGEEYYSITRITGSSEFFVEGLSQKNNVNPTPSPTTNTTSNASALSDGEYYGLLTDWNTKRITIELMDYKGRYEQSFNYILSATGKNLTLDISKASVWLEGPWSDDGSEIKCDTIESALSTKIWGGETTVRDNCSMEIRVVVKNAAVTDVVILYAA